jgi:hypothetical protein
VTEPLDIHRSPPSQQFLAGNVDGRLRASSGGDVHGDVDAPPVILRLARPLLGSLGIVLLQQRRDDAS